jgi:hypothetical protein
MQSAYLSCSLLRIILLSQRAVCRSPWVFGPIAQRVDVCTDWLDCGHWLYLYTPARKPKDKLIISACSAWFNSKALACIFSLRIRSLEWKYFCSYLRQTESNSRKLCEYVSVLNLECQNEILNVHLTLELYHIAVCAHYASIQYTAICYVIWDILPMIKTTQFFKYILCFWCLRFISLQWWIFGHKTSAGVCCWRRNLPQKDSTKQDIISQP